MFMGLKKTAILLQIFWFNDSMARLFIPVGNTDNQYIWVIDKDEHGKVKREKKYGVRYVPLTDEPPNK